MLATDRRAALTARATVCSVAALVLVVLAAGLTWTHSTPWDRPLRYLLLLPLAWLALALGWSRVVAPRWLLPVVGGLVGLASLALIVAAHRGVGYDRYRSDLRAVEPVADAALAAWSGPPFATCGPAPTADYGGLGTPDRWCVRVSGTASGVPLRSVELWWGDRSLLLQRGSADRPTARCVADLPDGWQATTELGDRPGCPSGFTWTGV